MRTREEEKQVAGKQTELICPHCGKPTPSAGVRCVHCGAAFRFCKNCGALNGAEQSYCTNCGAELYKKAEQGGGSAAAQGTAAAEGGQAVSAENGLSGAGKAPERKQILDLWAEERPADAAVNKMLGNARRSLMISYLVLYGIGIVLYAIGVFIRNASYDTWNTLLRIGVFFLAIGVLLMWVYALLNMLYVFRSNKKCAQWLTQSKADALALACEELYFNQSKYRRPRRYEKRTIGVDAAYMSLSTSGRGLFMAAYLLHFFATVFGGVAIVLLFGRGVFWFSSTLPFIIFGLLFCATEIVGVILFSAHKSARDAYINAAWAERIGAEQK